MIDISAIGGQNEYFISRLYPDMESKKEVFEAMFRYTQGLSVALGYRDLMTRLHSERVHGISELIGSHYEGEDLDMNALSIGAWFHDIGKIGIPDAILLKPDIFDAAEWEVMKRHSEIGEDIMLSTGLEESWRAALAIRHHHEHYDGGGYPDGLSGKAIPICSRIISIADSYDALAVVRSYHGARNHEEIMAMLNDERGKKYDPELMEIFSSIMAHSPYRVE